MTVMPLFAFDPGLGFEMFVIDLPQGTFSESPAHAPGIVEHVVVIEGSWNSRSRGSGTAWKPAMPCASPPTNPCLSQSRCG
ncbi:hypothetical protein [Salinicola tamaricis]|uniref:hypothetical protein n=1 Tax=Salinicola tamaricis TaxID=1771309 RepID=UPI001F5CA6F2|nr:hypothetical protein [Salinicola tamaricis]